MALKCFDNVWDLDASAAPRDALSVPSLTQMPYTCAVRDLIEARLLSIVKIAAAFRVLSKLGGAYKDAVRYVLRTLARRWQVLNNEVRALDAMIASYMLATAPALLERIGIGPEVASALLVAAGDNPERMKSEASFAAMCGASPVDASSGRQRHHRLNRAGNRDANRALWGIAFMTPRQPWIHYSDA